MRHECVIFIESVLNCIKLADELLFRIYSLSSVVVAEPSKNTNLQILKGVVGKIANDQPLACFCCF